MKPLNVEQVSLIENSGGSNKDTETSQDSADAEVIISTPSLLGRLQAKRNRGLVCAICWSIATLCFVVFLYSQGKPQASIESKAALESNSSGNFSAVSLATNTTTQPPTAADTSSSLDIIPTGLPAGYPISDLVQQQIKSYRQGTGIILNLHITHHAGTTMCGSLGHATNAPTVVAPNGCNLNSARKLFDEPGFPYDHPWKQSETAPNIDLVRPHLHFIAWEYRAHPKRAELSENDWENPKLLSLLVIRHPISRLLAGDGLVHSKYPNMKENGPEEQWWQWAHDSMNNNFALRILTKAGCCQGNNTDPSFLEAAKELVSRFSFVLDLDCLNEGIEAVANMTGLELAPLRPKKPHIGTSLKDRFPYEGVYDYLVERNKLDIELYEYAQKRALINCAALPSTNS